MAEDGVRAISFYIFQQQGRFLTVCHARFMYNPDVVRDILFSARDPDHRMHKKPRLSETNALQMDVDDGPPFAGGPLSKQQKGPSIVVETLSETFLISPSSDIGTADKENAANGIEHQTNLARYNVALVKIHEQPPPDSPPAAPAPAPVPAPDADTDVPMSDAPSGSPDEIIKADIGPLSEAPAASSAPRPQTSSADAASTSDPASAISEAPPVPADGGGDRDAAGPGEGTTAIAKSGLGPGPEGENENGKEKMQEKGKEAADQLVASDAPQTLPPSSSPPVPIPSITEVPGPAPASGAETQQPAAPATDSEKPPATVDNGSVGDAAPKEGGAEGAMEEAKMAGSVLEKTGPAPDAQPVEATAATEPAPQTSIPEQKNEVMSKDTPAKSDVPKTVASVPRRAPAQRRIVKTLEILQRNVGREDMLFEADGISILSSQVENGMRKGWKIEARSWRWASDELAGSS